MVKQRTIVFLGAGVFLFLISSNIFRTENVKNNKSSIFDLSYAGDVSVIPTSQSGKAYSNWEDIAKFNCTTLHCRNRPNTFSLFNFNPTNSNIALAILHRQIHLKYSECEYRLKLAFPYTYTSYNTDPYWDYRYLMPTTKTSNIRTALQQNSAINQDFSPTGLTFVYNSPVYTDSNNLTKVISYSYEWLGEFYSPDSYDVKFYFRVTSMNEQGEWKDEQLSPRLLPNHYVLQARCQPL